MAFWARTLTPSQAAELYSFGSIPKLGTLVPLGMAGLALLAYAALATASTGRILPVGRFGLFCYNVGIGKAGGVATPSAKRTPAATCSPAFRAALPAVRPDKGKAGIMTGSSSILHCFIGACKAAEARLKRNLVCAGSVRT